MPVARGYPDEDHLSKLRVWAVEPFFGGSHKDFLEGLCKHTGHDMTPLTLPGRNWKWRMHGGAIGLAEQARELLGDSGSGLRLGRLTGGSMPDVIFASDMLDLPTFLAVAGPRLAAVPAVMYFHENQLTYPLPADTPRDLGYGMKNIAGALAARLVLFNSRYHRREFLDGVRDLLDSLPDEVPDIVAGLEGKSRVLPLGCDLRRFDGARERGLAEAASGRWGDVAAGPLVLWNQRWEYDKAPEVALGALAELKEQGVRFRVAVAGCGNSREPEHFSQARTILGDRVVQWGRLEDPADYASLLWASDVVLSTAIHEFFGAAVVEAIYCGCRPVLPRRLSYPEIVPAEAHEEVLYREGELLAALAQAIEHPRPWSQDWQRTWVARYDWAALRRRYDEEIRRCHRAAREEW
jgi:glycosyltransferase involved in cell wall biosynthesis